MTPFVSALLQTGAVLGSAIVLIPAYSASEKQVGTSSAPRARLPVRFP
jgi:hypothetical protein